MEKKEEAVEAEDPPFGICYKMANYGRISDFKMSMEAS